MCVGVVSTRIPLQTNHTESPIHIEPRTIDQCGCRLKPATRIPLQLNHTESPTHIEPRTIDQCVCRLKAATRIPLQPNHTETPLQPATRIPLQPKPHRNSNTQQTKNNTTNLVIQQNSRKLLMMAIIMPETCWAHKKLNKIASFSLQLQPATRIAHQHNHFESPTRIEPRTIRPMWLQAEASACNTDTTPTQPHRNNNTHRTKNNTTNVVIEQNSRKLLMMDILMSEIFWAQKKWNKIASDIKLVFYSSTIAMMHGPIDIRFLTVFIVTLYMTLGFGWVVVNAVTNIRLQVGRDGVVGVVTCYGLDDPGIESRWRRDFPHSSRPAQSPLCFLYFWVPGLFLWVKQARGVALITHPHLALKIKKD